MSHQIFISYALEDKSIADAVCKALEAEGIACWYAPRDIPFTMEYEDAIVNAISASSLMVLILSNHSNNSAHVRREVQNACREDPQVPVLPFQTEQVALSGSLKYYIGSAQRLTAVTPPFKGHIRKLVEYTQKFLSEVRATSDTVTKEFETREKKAPAALVAQSKDEDAKKAPAAAPRHWRTIIAVALGCALIMFWGGLYLYRVRKGSISEPRNGVPANIIQDNQRSAPPSPTNTPLIRNSPDPRKTPIRRTTDADAQINRILSRGASPLPNSAGTPRSSKGGTPNSNREE